MLYLLCSCNTGWALTLHALLQQTFLSGPRPQLSFRGLLPATFPPFCYSHFPRLPLRYFFMVLEQEMQSEGGKEQMPTRVLERALNPLQDKWHLSRVVLRRDSHRGLTAPRLPAGIALVLCSAGTRWSSLGILTCACFTDLTLLPFLIQTLRSGSPGLLFLIAPGCFCPEIH